MSDETNHTPSEDKSGIDIDLTPVEEKPPRNYEEAMDCDRQEVELPSIDFFIKKM